MKYSGVENNFELQDFHAVFFFYCRDHCLVNIFGALALDYVKS